MKQRTDVAGGRFENTLRFAGKVLAAPVLLVRFSCRKRRIGAENAHLRCLFQLSSE